MNRNLLLILFLALLTIGTIGFLAHDVDAALPDTLWMASPGNHSTDVPSQPRLSVLLPIGNWTHATIQWYAMERSAWVLRATQADIHSGLHSVNATWFDGYNVTYYWRVVILYLNGSSEGVVFEFTTRDRVVPMEMKKDNPDLLLPCAIGIIILLVVVGGIIVLYKARSR